MPLAPRNSECLRLSALAELDLDDIIDRFDLLAEQPGMGRARPEFGPGVRSFAVENFVIYYRQEDDVLIARILHGRRDQMAAWSESS